MNDLDAMRQKALQQIDRAERWFKTGIFGAVLFEAVFLLGILFLADWRNPLHLLILCCTGLIYMPVFFGFIALGAWVNRCVLRVLVRLDDRSTA